MSTFGLYQRSIEHMPHDLESRDDGGDVPGYWQRHLMSFIRAMTILLVILVFVNLFLGLASGHVSFMPLLPFMFLWLVLYIGHVGAHKPSTSYLLAYFVLNVLIFTFIIVTFAMFPAFLGTLLCIFDGHYGNGCTWGEAGAIVHITFVGFNLAFFPCLFAIVGAVFGMRARNELITAQIRASIVAELGATISPGRASISDHIAAPPQRSYNSFDYRPVVYTPNPPYFSSSAMTGAQHQQAASSPVQFPPPPASYYYYPPPPLRSAGITTPVPATAPPAVTTHTAVPVPPPSDPKNSN